MYLYASKAQGILDAVGDEICKAYRQVAGFEKKLQAGDVKL